MSKKESTEPFPTLSPIQSREQDSRNVTTPDNAGRPRAASSNASHNRPTRSRSLIQNFITSSPPLGVWQATGEVASKIPTLAEIHDGAFGDEGWSQEGQMEQRGTNPHEIHRRTSRARRSSASLGVRTTNPVLNTDFATAPISKSPPLPTSYVDEAQSNQSTSQNLSPPTSSEDYSPAPSSPSPVPTTQRDASRQDKSEKIVDIANVSSTVEGPDETGTYPNGYRFPKKHTWKQSISIQLKGFWKFFITFWGFLITIYALNVVAWGAMIFFLLLNAAPGMCKRTPNCNDFYSARNIWIEIDSQVLTGLFCVPAFGLFPWRARDFYYLMKWRLGSSSDSHRKLAGIYRSWYRLPGSDNLPENVAPLPVRDTQEGSNSTSHSKNSPATTLNELEKHPRELENGLVPQSEEDEKEFNQLVANPAVPLPPSMIPEAPLTGIRAPPTRSWTLDIVIWMYQLNTWVQVGLCGIIWGINRRNRPSWATGFLIGLGCVTGIVAGIVVMIEGRRVKWIEGIKVMEYDIEESTDDFQRRKAKQDAKQAKKQQKQQKGNQTEFDESHIVRVEKVKGQSWFTRH